MYSSIIATASSSSLRVCRALAIEDVALGNVGEVVVDQPVLDQVLHVLHGRQPVVFVQDVEQFDRLAGDLLGQGVIVVAAGTERFIDRFRDFALVKRDNATVSFSDGAYHRNEFLSSLLPSTNPTAGPTRRGVAPRASDRGGSDFGSERFLPIRRVARSLSGCPVGLFCSLRSPPRPSCQDRIKRP
jgi:hypothetical protein